MTFPPKCRPRGFTLVELLVVIAIIGVLVALLLPAVQAAREAARRSQCSNNLKQLSLGVHNFHDTFKRLPPAGASDSAPEFGTAPRGGRWGASWLVHIMPFVEQKTVYDQMRFDGVGGGTGWGSGGANDSVTSAVVAANNVFISTYFCPSSPLSKWCSSNPPGTPAGGRIMAPNYVAISGATGETAAVTDPAIHLIDPTIYKETRCNSGGASAGCCSGGIHCASGAMVASGTHGLEAVSDGTSNTFMISESSNWIFTQSNLRQDWRASHTHGLIIGWHNPCTPPNCGNGGDMRTFNFTTVRYPINHFSRPQHGLPDPPGNCSSHGVCDNSSTNRPLNSAHPTGINVALADGSVRFVQQNIARDLLGRAVHRDDNLSLTLQ